MLKGATCDLTTDYNLSMFYIALLKATQCKGNVVIFTEGFTLAEIAERAGLPIERLRYVVDAEILPGQRRSKSETAARQPGRGIPRKFMALEAFSLVLVVLMLEGGIRRRVARDCMDLLAAAVVPNSQHPRDVLLVRVFSDQRIVALEIGDGVNIRLIHEGGSAASPLPRAWLQSKTGATVEKYDPLLAVRINFARLRSYFA
jgi:hypothetical protein